jgi:hypothetical protein
MGTKIRWLVLAIGLLSLCGGMAPLHAQHGTAPPNSSSGRRYWQEWRRREEDRQRRWQEEQVGNWANDKRRQLQREQWQRRRDGQPQRPTEGALERSRRGPTD